MRQVQLTPEQVEAVFYACKYWANFIETGNLRLSADEAKQRGERCKNLEDDQKQVVARLREVMGKIRP